MKQFFVLLLLLIVMPLKAQVDYEKVDIQLYTFGAGETYWEAFGHSGLRVKINSVDYMYGFGYFDFNDEDFFLKFAKGEMQYFLGIEYTNNEIEDYIAQGRSVWSQKLNLTPQQKQQLIDKLNYLAQKENRYYPYDYFLNNCTSKIRDLLDEITNGDISKQLKAVETDKSWNDLTFPVKNQSWMNLGIAIAYGIPAYQKRDKWQLSVFPQDFATDLEGLKIKSQWNGELTLHNKAENRLAEYSFFNTHYAILLLISIVLLGLFFTRTFKATVYSWLSIQSVLGLGVLSLWFFSKHSVAFWNINILLFFPLSFLFLIKQWQNKAVIVLLILNFVWLLLAGLFTSYYLLGFNLINLIICFKFNGITQSRFK